MARIAGAFDAERIIRSPLHRPPACLVPDNDVLRYNIRVVYERMGQPAHALAGFERSASINLREVLGASRVWASGRAEELRMRTL